MSRVTKGLLTAILAVLGLVSAIWAWNQYTVGRWVETALNSDPRNESFEIDGRYRYYVLRGTLVLDLTEVRPADTSPAGLWRGLFQIAERSANDERHFDRVILARSREPVFIMEGEDFYRLGEERSLGQNPVYQIRTLPEKLYRPNGEGAYGRWTGGMLGVVKEQMEDVNEAARVWVRGIPPSGH